MNVHICLPNERAFDTLMDVFGYGWDMWDERERPEELEEMRGDPDEVWGVLREAKQRIMARRVGADE